MSGDLASLDLPFTRHDTDARGNVRWYYVTPGNPKVRLNPKGVEIGSEEFLERYKEAHAGRLRGRQKRQRLASGTLGHLIEAYVTSPDFTGLARNTQAARRRILLKIQDEHGKLPAQLTPQVVRNSRDKRAKTPAAANEFVKILSTMYNWAINAGLADANPAAKIKRLKEGDGHRAWTDDEMQAFRDRWPLGTRERLAFEMLYQTAQRIDDIAMLGPQHVSGNILRFTQGKTGTKMAIPITQELSEAMRLYPPKGMKFLGYKNGASLSNRFRVWRDEAGLPIDCKAHGLRATRATDLANQGKTAHQIMAITGHKSLQEAQRYTRGADQERLAREALGEQMVPLFDPKSQRDRPTFKKGL